MMHVWLMVDGRRVDPAEDRGLTEELCAHLLLLTETRARFLGVLKARDLTPLLERVVLRPPPAYPAVAYERGERWQTWDELIARKKT